METGERPSRVWRRLRHALWDAVPDPQGTVGLLLTIGLLLTHASVVASPSTGYLCSRHLLWEVLAHAWLLLGPPLAVYLGVRHLVVKGTSLLPFVSVPLSGFLTLLTLVGLAMALVH